MKRTLWRLWPRTELMETIQQSKPGKYGFGVRHHRLPWFAYAFTLTSVLKRPSRTCNIATVISKGEQMRNTMAIKFLGFTVLLLALSGALWAKKFPLTATPKVPAASGEIKASTDKNGNTTVELKVWHLAKPGNLTPSATVYVVWFQQQGQPPAKQGELKVNGKLSGEIKASTPMKNFDVSITAESDPNVNNPNGEEVLRTTVQM
jgi:hypothetical protein